MRVSIRKNGTGEGVDLCYASTLPAERRPRCARGLNAAEER